MTWLSKNYEKAALWGALFLALILGVVIYLKIQGAKDAYKEHAYTRNDDASVEGLPAIKQTQKSLSETHAITQRELDGRRVNLFTSVPLFSKKDKPKKVIDLVKSEPVHPPIENAWWLEHDIDPMPADAQDGDPDEDGYSNLEEYTAKTDPRDAQSHPSLLDKLKIHEVETNQVHIKPTDFGGGRSVFRLETKSGARINKMKPEPIDPGTTIPFVEPLMQNRFKFVSLEKENLPSGVVETIWVIEDMKKNKLGTQYKFNRRGNLQGLKDRSRGIMDSTVEFSLNAVDQEDKLFKVEENTRFNLPFDPQESVKPYLLKKVDIQEKTLTVEYSGQDGKSLTHVQNY